MEIERKQFQGVLNILSFNRHFYVIGLIVLALITVAWFKIGLSTIGYWIIFGAFMYGLLMPLLVSAYVYDFSGYYNFKWLKDFDLKDVKNNKIVNINGGFDETSFILNKHFPKSDLKVFDFYDAKNHTEPAIVRARKVSLTYPNTEQMTTGKIPLKSHTVETVFLLSAAHEIRSHKEKVQFLKECHRICKSNGNIIMVEHLLDTANFLAFSIGFTHFFSKKTWKEVFKESGFQLLKEEKFTPFMSVFQFTSK